jgi:HSP20 family protein
MMPEQAKVQQVPLKVYRAADRLTVATPMAGMEPVDITIEITADGRLLLDGEVRGMLKGVKELLLDEWSVGAYYRDYLLPEAVDGSQAAATYGNGVLVVTFPISARTVPARLTLSSTGIAHGISDNVALP